MGTNAELLMRVIGMCTNNDLKEARKLNKEMFDHVAGVMYTISEMDDFDIDDKE